MVPICSPRRYSSSRGPIFSASSRVAAPRARNPRKENGRTRRTRWRGLRLGRLRTLISALAEAREVRSNHPSRVTMESTKLSRSASGRVRVTPAPPFGGVCVVVSPCEDGLQRAIASDGANRTYDNAELLAWPRILLRSSVIANCKAGFRPSSCANVGSGTPLSPIAFPPGRSARKDFSWFSLRDRPPPGHIRIEVPRRTGGGCR